MNYEQPRQVDPKADRPDAGKWRWTVRNDDRIWPGGNCSPIQTCPDCNGHSFMTTNACARCESKGVITVETPCAGHDTEEGAREHQREYMIANVKRVVHDDVTAQQLLRCQSCGKHTASYVMIGTYRIEHLCPEHQTEEILREIIHLPGNSAHS